MGAGRPAGGKKSGGRKKGTRNKASLTVKELCAAVGYDPIAELMAAAKMAYDELQFSKVHNNLNSQGRAEFMKIIQKSGAEIAPYIHARLKSLQVTDDKGNNVFGQTFVDMVAAMVDRKNNGDKPGPT